jgi:hypothetical protein
MHLTVLLARLYTRQRRTAVCPAATVRFAGSRTSNRGPSSHFRMFGPEKSPPMWSPPPPPPPLPLPPPPPRLIVTPLAAGPAKPETNRARICKRLSSPGIDFASLFVAWWAGTTNRVIVPGCQAGNRFLGSFKGLQIRARDKVCF